MSTHLLFFSKIMKNIIVCSSLFLSAFALFPTAISAQTTPSVGLQGQYPTTGTIPPINNINNGIQQGSFGYGGSSQCGTSISLGGTSSPSATNSVSIIDNSVSRGDNALGVQVMISHNIGNPCMPQKEQICTTGKIQLIQNNPTMEMNKLKELLSLFDRFCGK
jgi:hypothetical protein